MKTKDEKNFWDILEQDELITDFTFNHMLYEEQLEINF